jgi:hypothetical protein
MNLSVVRPLVDRLYDLNDVSVGMLHFLSFNQIRVMYTSVFLYYTDLLFALKCGHKGYICTKKSFNYRV